MMNKEYIFYNKAISYFIVFYRIRNTILLIP